MSAEAMLMDDITELRSMNEARASAGDRTAALTVRLVEAYLDLLVHLSRRDRELAAKDDMIRGLCDRVEAQSQLLSKRAEK